MGINVPDGRDRSDLIAFLRAPFPDNGTEEARASAVVPSSLPASRVAPAPGARPATTKWDWATRDGAQAIEMPMPYENVTVFYGHIHQEHHHMTGHIAHHSAKSLVFSAIGGSGLAARKQTFRDRAIEPRVNGTGTLAADSWTTRRRMLDCGSRCR
jgi:hypothetical protein